MKPAWFANNVRFTGFLSQPVKTSVSDLFKAVFAEPLQEITQRPNEGVSIAASTIDDKKLTLALNAERLDLMIEATPTGGETIESLCPSAEGLSIIAEKAGVLVRAVGGINRYAVGGIFNSPAASVEDAYDRLRDILKIPYLEWAKTTDFFLQINRPKQINVDSTLRSINRLTTWSIMSRTKSSFDVGTGAVSGVKRTSCALRLMTDINTIPTQAMDAENATLNIEKLISELAAASADILEKGPL